MVWIVFRTGKAVRYNDAETWCYENNGTLASLTCNEQGKTCHICSIPLEVIERIEFSRPCLIRKDHGRRDRLPIAR